MRGAVLYGPRDVRFEERGVPTVIKPTDAIIRISPTCVCASDLWPYRGINPIPQPTPVGHEYCGIVEEVGSAVKSIKPGQFVIGSFFASDNTCPNCQVGYQSSCQHAEFVSTAPGECTAYPARGRDAGGHSGYSLGGLGPEPAIALRCNGHRLVRRRRRQRQARLDWWSLVMAPSASSVCSPPSRSVLSGSS